MTNEEKLNKINEAASLRCSEALSKLMGEAVNTVFFSPILTSVKEISPVISPEELGVGVYLPIKGGANGTALLFLPKETARNLRDMMMKKELQTTRELSAFDEGVLRETGNIILGNYLAVLSNSLKAEIIAGMPKLSSGMFDAILGEVIINFVKDFSKVLVVRLEFKLAASKKKGYLLLLFKPEIIEALLNAL